MPFNLPPKISEDLAALLASGVLGNAVTHKRYLSFPVLKPDELPESFQDQYNNYGEVRLLRS